MALIKHFPKGKKKTLETNSAGSRKTGTVVKAGAGKGTSEKSASNQKNKKHPRSGGFSSLKSRQMLVERIKRAIWASVAEINQAIITLAKAGNFQAAKSLFDFAGVYSLPEREEERPQAAPVPAPAAEQQTQDPVDAFFRSIGMSSDPKPAEPEMAVAGL